MTDAVSRLRLDYAPSFLAYLSRRDEAGLRTAYELGRGAMADGVSLLELVNVHHAALLDVLTTAQNPSEMHDLGDAAASFLVEALASFEMTQRRPGPGPGGPAGRRRR